MGNYIDETYMGLRYKNSTLISQTNNIANTETGAIVSTVLAALIEDAEAIIDSHIGRRYTVPLTVIPADIKRYAGDITYWELIKTVIDGEPRKVALNSYNEAMTDLQKIKSGKLIIDGVSIKTTNQFYLKAGTTGSTSSELAEARYKEVDENYGNRIFRT